MLHQFRLFFITLLATISIIADSPIVTASVQQGNITHSSIEAYSALKLFLEDEQHLTTIRRVKMLISFSGISDKSRELIDEIASTSELAVEELETLASQKPAFEFNDFTDETIAKATIDSLRMTTAKEFLFDSENFEKNLLISQLKILRLISHLARQLEETESNQERKIWLLKIADRYENFYQKTRSEIFISS